MTQDRIILVIIILTAIGFSIAFDLPNELVNLLLASSILIQESYEYYKFHKLSNSKTLFRFANYEWLGALGVSGFILYWFSDEPMNILNIIAITEVFIFTGIYIIRNWTLNYIIEEEGIRNLSDGKLIELNTITRIKINEEQLAIDTTKFQNDLIVKSSNLKTPSWAELTEEFAKLKRT